eukprot:450151-Hanusia_phi.AAC.1
MEWNEDAGKQKIRQPSRNHALAKDEWHAMMKAEIYTARAARRGLLHCGRELPGCPASDFHAAPGRRNFGMLLWDPE